MLKGVSEERFKEVVGEAFAAVRFPSMPCHLWRVAKVRGEGATGGTPVVPGAPPRWRLPIGEGRNLVRPTREGRRWGMVVARQRDHVYEIIRYEKFRKFALDSSALERV